MSDYETKYWDAGEAPDLTKWVDENVGAALKEHISDCFLYFAEPEDGEKVPPPIMIVCSFADLDDDPEFRFVKPLGDLVDFALSSYVGPDPDVLRSDEPHYAFLTTLRDEFASYIAKIEAVLPETTDE